MRVTLGPLGVDRREDGRGEHAAWMNDVVLRQGLAVVLPRHSKDAHVQRWLAGEGHRDALVVPLPGASGIIAMLVVANRRGEVRTFDQDDVLLLETLANHASVALQRGELIERLQHDAFHDTLTGLPNRTYLQDELARYLAPGPGRVDGFAVMVLDLNGFKEVNDTLGHHQGDVVLIEVARRLVDAVAGGGVVGRLGGDEFAVLVPGVVDRRRPETIAERVHASLETPIDAPRAPHGGRGLDRRGDLPRARSGRCAAAQARGPRNVRRQDVGAANHLLRADHRHHQCPQALHGERAARGPPVGRRHRPRAAAGRCVHR